MTAASPDGSGDELDRLRALVGPSEVAYESLLNDRAAAEALAKQALSETGELRGRLEEMSVQLSRARQDQDVLLRRADMTPWRRVADRLQRRWTTSVAPRVSTLLRRS